MTKAQREFVSALSVHIFTSKSEASSYRLKVVTGVDMVDVGPYSIAPGASLE